MNDLQLFNNPEFGAIRSIEIEGEPWFVGNDIARALGYVNPRDALINHVDEDDTAIRDAIDSMGRNQPTKFINESGMYALIILSGLPSAKKFKRWITKEVIPSIIKTGSYNLPQLTPNELVLKIAENAVKLEKRVDGLEQTQNRLESKLDTAIQVFSRPDKDHWVADITQKIDQMVEDYRLSPMAFKGKLYKELERNANVLLQSRLNRLKRRLKKQGMTYREAEAVTKLDAISKDRQLRVIFEGIVRKHQATYGSQQET